MQRPFSKGFAPTIGPSSALRQYGTYFHRIPRRPKCTTSCIVADANTITLLDYGKASLLPPKLILSTCRRFEAKWDYHDLMNHNDSEIVL